jgi:phosphonate transport system substrate-binding protein
MARDLRVGAVAYDPKVVPIWEGIREVLGAEGVPVEVELFLSYPSQVQALLDRRIDVAWNTNLAYVQSVSWSRGACTPIGMRDTDRGWNSVVIAPCGGPLATSRDLVGRTLALGSRDSGHAAILPVHFLGLEGLREGREYRSLRFDTDVGKHGDTGRSELEVLQSVLDGRADAGAVGRPFWEAVLRQGLAPKGALQVIWTSPPFNHCMFTAAADLEPTWGSRFLDGLRRMRYDDPAHRAILEAEGLREWLRPSPDGYDSLEAAARAQGFLERGREGGG